MEPILKFQDQKSVHSCLARKPHRTSQIEDMEIDPPQQESTSQLELNLIPKPSPNVYEVANPTRLLVTLAHRIPAF